MTGVGIAAAAALAVTTASALPAAAEGTILGTDSPDAIPGSYLVVLADGASTQSGGVAAAVAETADKYGADVTHTYTSAIHGFAATMSEKQAKRLAADPAVDYVEADQKVSLSQAGTQPNPPSWGLDRIDQRNLPLNNSYSYPNQGAGVHAYIIDTGVRITHNDFGNRATWAVNTVDSNNTDCNGHGTHVAGTTGGTAYGVAKQVRLYAVKVLNCQGSGTLAGVTAGVDWVTANHQSPAVANMSLGASGTNATMENAVRNSIAAGVTYAIASGNSNANACNFTPARVAEAMTVNASQNNDARASFSNWGTCTQIFAPGVNITAPWHTSNTATNTISGTSMAAPHVAGAAALYLAANPGSTPAQVMAGMVNMATDGVISNPGTGSPNKLLFVGEGGGEPPPPPPPPDCDSITNNTPTPIPDAPSPGVTSNIVVTECEGNAPSNLRVQVSITHGWRGDLQIDLVAPNGQTYRLKNASFWDWTPNVNTTYTVNASSHPANGTWGLRIRDVYSGITGTLNTWTLHFG